MISWYSTVSIEASRAAANALVVVKVFYPIKTWRLREGMLNRLAFSATGRFPSPSVPCWLSRCSSPTLRSPQQLFDNGATGLADWPCHVLVVTPVFLLVELEKFILREVERRRRKVPGRPLDR